MTQEGVAEAVGVNRRTVQMWEAGNFYPAEETLNSLATLYGKPLAWFLEGEGDEFAQRLDGMRVRMEQLPEPYIDVIEACLTALEKAVGSSK